jgi:hypothetical protein
MIKEEELGDYTQVDKNVANQPIPLNNGIKL